MTQFCRQYIVTQFCRLYTMTQFCRPYIVTQFWRPGPENSAVLPLKYHDTSVPPIYFFKHLEEFRNQQQFPWITAKFEMKNWAAKLCLAFGGKTVLQYMGGKTVCLPGAVNLCFYIRAAKLCFK